MILQRVTLTIQPLGVGYVNRPKKAQNGGVCGFPPYISLPGVDLTTSARLFSSVNATATAGAFVGPVARATKA